MRYVPLSVGIFFGLLLAACVHGWSPASRGRGLRGTLRAARALVVRCATVLVKRWRTSTLPVVAPYAVGFVLLAVAFEHWYGSPDLHASYEAYGSPAVGTGHWDFWYHFALRDILDPVVGWIPFAPVHWLGFAGLGCLVVMFGWPAAGAIAVAAGYELLISSVGTGVGFGLPARYPMIVVPLIAVPLAVVIQKIRVARLMFVPLLAVSLVFAVAAARELRTVVSRRRSADRRTAQHGPGFPGAGRRSGAGVLHPGAGRVAGAADGEARRRRGRRKGASRRRRVRPVRAVGGAQGRRIQATFALAAEGVRPSAPAATVQIIGAGASGIAQQGAHRPRAAVAAASRTST